MMAFLAAIFGGGIVPPDPAFMANNVALLAGS
jgi:hypothetical protein